MRKEGDVRRWQNPLGMSCRPTVFLATVLLRVQALRNVFRSFPGARFSDRFTVVLDDFLLIGVNRSLSVLAVRRRPWRISLVRQDKTRFCIRFQSHPKLHWDNPF
jgi:hypothetical protein